MSTARSSGADSTDPDPRIVQSLLVASLATLVLQLVLVVCAMLTR